MLCVLYVLYEKRLAFDVILGKINTRKDLRLTSCWVKWSDAPVKLEQEISEPKHEMGIVHKASQMLLMNGSCQRSPSNSRPVINLQKFIGGQPMMTPISVTVMSDPCCAMFFLLIICMYFNKTSLTSNLLPATWNSIWANFSVMHGLS